MRRPFLIALLMLGVVGGYGSSIASAVRYHRYGSAGWACPRSGQRVDAATANEKADRALAQAAEAQLQAQSQELALAMAQAQVKALTQALAQAQVQQLQLTAPPAAPPPAKP